MVNIKDQDSVTKIIDMVPDIINKFTKSGKKKEEMDERVEEVMKSQTEATMHE